MNGFNEKIELKIQETCEIKMRTYFSIQHIQSAALFCRLSSKLENEYIGKFNQELITEYKAYVTNSIFSCVCFLPTIPNSHKLG